MSRHLILSVPFSPFLDDAYDAYDDISKYQFRHHSTFPPKTYELFLSTACEEDTG